MIVVRLREEAVKAVFDRDTGVARWMDETGNREAETVVLSPEELARAIKASDRAVREAEQKRRSFKDCSYDKEELARAKSNRGRQTIVYPDACPETEESKLKSRAARRQRVESLNRKGGLVMVQPTFDASSGAVKFPKPVAPGEKAVKAVVDMAYVGIPKATATRLAKLAVKDGFKADAETPKGRDIQTAKAVRVYVLGAIDTLLAKRGG